MAINTADSLLNTDCLIPINRDGKEFYYWKIDLPPSLLEEVRLKILGEKVMNNIDIKNYDILKCPSVP